MVAHCTRSTRRWSCLALSFIPTRPPERVARYQLGGWSSCSSCELSHHTSTDDGGAIWSTAEDLALTESDVTWNETRRKQRRRVLRGRPSPD